MKQRRPRAGFTLLELTVVLAISMIVLAVGVPSMMTVIANARRRSSMMALSGLIQQCRSQAVRQNKVMQVFNTSVDGVSFYYVKDPTATSTDMLTTDPQAMLGRNIVYITEPSGAGAPSTLDATSMWGSSEAITPNTSGNVWFNAIGLPCVRSGSVCTSGTGFVLYFEYMAPFGRNQWAAMSVSPAGRVKAWYWSGSEWSN